VAFLLPRGNRGRGGEGRGQPGGGDGVEAICLSRADSFRLQTRRIVCEGAPSPLETPVRGGADGPVEETKGRGTRRRRWRGGRGGGVGGGGGGGAEEDRG